MQIQNPTAVMIARTAVAQDDITGYAAVLLLSLFQPGFARLINKSKSHYLCCSDGTTSMVLFIGELMKRAEGHLQEGLHPRVICEGFEIAKNAALAFLEKMRVPVNVSMDNVDRHVLTCTARTALRTKLYDEIAEQFTSICVDSVLIIRKPDLPIDLHMVEVH